MSSSGKTPDIPDPTPLPESIEEQEKLSKNFERERRMRAVSRGNTILTSRGTGSVLGG